MAFTYTAASLEAQVLQELGGADPTAKQTTAIRNGIQEGLTDIWYADFWSWRKRRMDVSLTASTPYYDLPADYDSMSLTEIFRTDSDDSEPHFMVSAPDALFERLYFTASSAEPRMFRITRRQVGSTYVDVLEGAPQADGSYTYSDVEYFCSAPEISFTSGTVSDTTPNMPTEFHDIWHAQALAAAAAVLGQRDVAADHYGLYERKLETARKHRDRTFPKGPPRGVTLPYNDLARLRF